jgi:hypothetical protein
VSKAPPKPNAVSVLDLLRLPGWSLQGNVSGLAVNETSSSTTEINTLEQWTLLSCVRLRLDNFASLQQGAERLGVVEEQAVVDHVLVVSRESDERFSLRHKLKSP